MNELTKNEKILKLIKFTFTLVLFITLILAFFFNDNKTYDYDDENVIFDGGWEEILDDGSRQPIASPFTIEGEKIVLVKRLPEVTDNTIITFEVKYSKAVASINGEVIYKSSLANLGSLTTGVGNYNIMVHLERKFSGEELKIEIYAREKIYPSTIRNIFITTRDAYALHTITSNILTVIFVIVFFFIGLTSLIIFLILKFSHYEFKSSLMDTFFYLFAFTSSLALWIVGNLSFIGILTGKLVLSGLINYLSFMALPLTVIGLVKSLLKKESLFITIMQYVTIGVEIFNLFMFYTGILDLTKSLILTQVLDLINIISLFVLFASLIKNKEIKNNSFFAIGFILVGLLCITGIILYILDFKWLDVVYIACFLSIVTLFVVCLGKLFEATREVFKNRQYYYFAYTDELTGLSNRKSYTEKLDDLEEVKNTNNVIFVALDVNNLKGANDTYGHSAGDKLIIEAANLIQDVFKDYGNCYRVGGDEFTVIIDKPVDSIDNLLLSLNEKAKQIKFEENITLSLAYGYSIMNIKDAKDINEYIKEADMSMYNNKKEYYSQAQFDRRRH